MPSTIQNPFVQQIPNKSTPLSALDSSGYDLNILKYPNEVGSNDVPSYVVFNIYVPTTDQYAVQHFASSQQVQSRSQNNSDYLKANAGKPQSLGATGTGVATIAGIAGLTSFAQTDGGVLERAGSGLGQAAATGLTATAISAFGNDLVSLKPKLRKINQSVAIYMPDTVMTSFNHDYGVVSATEAMGQLGLATAVGGAVSHTLNSTWSKLKNADWGLDLKKDAKIAGGIFQQMGAGFAGSPAGRELLGTLAESSGLVGSDFTGLALRSGGLAINPQVELLYRGTQNRSFIFEFRFQPRSAKEAQTIKNIIQTFKYFSSPSIQQGSRGRYFIVPGQFDITFKFGNIDNQFISQISTCVLEAIDINWSGSGQWTTMTDGAPADISMQLRFREAEIIYRELMADPTGQNQGQGF